MLMKSSDDVFSEQVEGGRKFERDYESGLGASFDAATKVLGMSGLGLDSSGAGAVDGDTVKYDLNGRRVRDAWETKREEREAARERRSAKERTKEAAAKRKTLAFDDESKKNKNRTAPQRKKKITLSDVDRYFNAARTLAA